MRLRYYCLGVMYSVISVGQLALAQNTSQELASPADASSQDTPSGVLPAGNELSDYVARPDENYRWEVREQQKIQNCDVLRLHLTSQRWQGVDWRHVLTLIKPAQVDPSGTDA